MIELVAKHPLYALAASPLLGVIAGLAYLGFEIVSAFRRGPVDADQEQTVRPETDR
ncbi:hypothetical protein NE236_41545 [Actinoallomurus purpureus]|uniref:hypothetical protein n=1 Tax=Actinoallomurus purpureus TaxID=478114 RepID=UPI002092BC25|nr:hypothetical protein [Actinoallomurus purpureus]MCO6011454.1 hypothetical protein [Actinoallomurus purpureus]